ncbi:MAG: hypothetical protein ACREVI_02480 [Steroidobacteraceae bacterium]
MSLQELLVVEDDPVLLQFACRETNVPLWPLIRNQFFRFVMSDLLFSNPLVVQRRGANLRRNPGAAVYGVARAAIHNAVRRRAVTGSVVMTSGSAGLLEREGRWFNRLTDHFAAALPDRTVILEDLFRWQWRVPRHHDRILYHTPLFLRGQAAGRARVRRRHFETAARLVGLVGARARRLIDWELGDERTAVLVRLLARETAAMPGMRRTYESLLARLQARVLIKEMGCYGRSAVFNATARDMGLTVAEHQHGLVSTGHDAYNVSPTLARSDEYRRTLPEYFLSFGAWWGEQISVPLTSVPIGNPHRTEQIARLARRPGDKADILILGDGIETDSYLALAAALKQRLGRERRVIFRPHPIERNRPEIARAKAVRLLHIDDRPDIYESFASASIVVSEASTGLFEAVGLVDRIFAMQSARSRFSLPRHPFESADGAQDLADKVLDGSAVNSGLRDVDRIWAPGWKRNYLEFLDGCLGDRASRPSA